MDLTKEQAIYNAIWTSHPKYRKVSPERRVLEARKVWLWDREKYGRILCVGCGPAAGVKYLVGTLGFDAHGLDISDAVRADFEAAGIAERFHHGEAHNMPFANDQFDAVVCCDVLEHIPVDLVDLSCREMRRVCKKRFLVSVSTQPANFRGMDGEELHVTVRDFYWWMEHMQEMGDVGFVSGGRGGFVMELRKSVPVE